MQVACPRPLCNGASQDSNPATCKSQVRCLTNSTTASPLSYWLFSCAVNLSTLTNVRFSKWLRTTAQRCYLIICIICTVMLLVTRPCFQNLFGCILQDRPPPGHSSAVLCWCICIYSMWFLQIWMTLMSRRNAICGKLLCYFWQCDPLIESKLLHNFCGDFFHLTAVFMGFVTHTCSITDLWGLAQGSEAVMEPTMLAPLCDVLPLKYELMYRCASFWIKLQWNG